MLPGGIGGLLVLVGAVWLLQGLNIVRGSFMSGNIVWSVIGAVLLLGGAVRIALTGRRRGRQLGSGGIEPGTGDTDGAQGQEGSAGESKTFPPK